MVTLVVLFGGQCVASWLGAEPYVVFWDLYLMVEFILQDRVNLYLIIIAKSIKPIIYNPKKL